MCGVKSIEAAPSAVMRTPPTMLGDPEIERFMRHADGDQQTSRKGSDPVSSPFDP
jgi:hypothetical protein